MRRIIVSMWTTLDGYVAGLNDEMGWLAGDDDMVQYETCLVAGAEALLLGRITHSDFSGTWPRIAHDENEASANRAYAIRVDEMPKLVVSRTGRIAEWRDTQRIADLDADTVQDVKQAGTGDLVVYGSLSVVARLQEMNAINEYHLLVHPTAIGVGKPLFAPARSPVQLRLISTETFTSGVVLMRYKPTDDQLL